MVWRLKDERSNRDGLVKSRKYREIVIPVKTGIQKFQCVTKTLDTGFHRCDDFLRGRQSLKKYESIARSIQKKFNGELSKICADLRRVQEISGREVVRLAPRRIVPTGHS